MPADFYTVLETADDASQADLKQAYRRCVREYHPDVNDSPHADAQFKLVRKAHDVLSNPATRKDYDRVGHRTYVDRNFDSLPSLSVFSHIDASSAPDGAGSATRTGSTSDATSSRNATSSPRSSAADADRSNRTNRSSGRSSSPNRSSSRGGSSSRSGASSAAGATSTSGASSTESSTGANPSSAASTDSGGSGGPGPSGSADSSTTSQSSTSRGAASTTGSTASGTTSSTTPGTTGTSGSTSEAGHSETAAGESSTSRSRSETSTTLSEGQRRRRGLKRWYGVVVLSFLLYLGGLAAYATPHAATLQEVLARLPITPLETLTSSVPFAAPAASALAPVLDGAVTVEVALFAGVVLLPLVVVTTVARFGRGSAWLYALGSVLPVATLGVWILGSTPLWLALVGLVVAPCLGVGGFLADVGRYLLATRN